MRNFKASGLEWANGCEEVVIRNAFFCNISIGYKCESNVDSHMIMPYWIFEKINELYERVSVTIGTQLFIDNKIPMLHAIFIEIACMWEIHRKLFWTIIPSNLNSFTFSKLSLPRSKWGKLMSEWELLNNIYFVLFRFINNPLAQNQL